MIIDLSYDAAATTEIGTTPAFQTTMQAAADMLEDHITNNITVNIQVGFGEIGGTALPANVSEGNISTFPTISYSSLLADLAANETSAADTTAVNNLPTGSSVDGQSSFVIGTAQEKALGLISATASGLDGLVGMNASFGTGALLFAGALHELTHAMGRIFGSTLDLFRFNEDLSGNRVFGGAIPSTAAYFALGTNAQGASKIADWGITSDPSDFLNGGVQGNDPFNETVGVLGLTAADLTLMDVLGFQVFNSAPTVTALSDSVGKDGPSCSKDLLTGAADPEDDAISVVNLDASVTTADGRTLALGTDYTLSGSTIALTATGFSKFNSLSEGTSDTAVFNYDVEDALGAGTPNTLSLTVNGSNEVR